MLDIFNFMHRCVVTRLNTYGFKQVREKCTIIMEFWRDTDKLFNKLGVYEFFCGETWQLRDTHKKESEYVMTLEDIFGW
jgi:hypothetical protein